MKTTTRLFAVVTLLAVTSWQNIMPAHAMPAKPFFDATGVWKNDSGETMQIFQENDEVNAVFVVNGGFAHRLTGRYVLVNVVRMVLIRRAPGPNGCEMTMAANLTVHGDKLVTLLAIASENACDLKSGQSFSSNWTRA